MSTEYKEGLYTNRKEEKRKANKTNSETNSVNSNQPHNHYMPTQQY